MDNVKLIARKWKHAYGGQLVAKHKNPDLA